MRYRRVYLPGSTYFFTVNLLNRTSSLLTDNIHFLRHAFKTTNSKCPFTIEAIVILPDHLHALITLPKHDSDFSLRWNHIKGSFSRQIEPNEAISSSRKNNRERGIWQRRFWEHLIKDELDFEHHVNYIHFNPVKHGYVTIPSQWEYSSIHRYIKEGLIGPNWAHSHDVGEGGFGER